jgi:hypothetical protein
MKVRLLLPAFSALPAKKEHTVSVVYVAGSVQEPV